MNPICRTLVQASALTLFAAAALFAQSCVRRAHSLRPRQWTGFPVDQRHGQAANECRWLDRHLFRPGVPRRWEELAENRS